MAVINTNVKALFSQMALKGSGIEQARAMQQLSTGKRINSARDDAAGMAIATRMTHQIRSLNQAVRNAGDAINLIQTAEGATNEITDMMQRMRELAVQAVNDTNDNAQRSYLDLEFQQLKQQIVQIADNTEWNGFPVLNGSAGERVGEMPVYKATSVSISKAGDIFIAEPKNPSVSGANAGQQQIMTFGGDGTTVPTAGTYEISLVDKDSNTHTASVAISAAEASGGWSSVVGKIKTVLDTEFKNLTSSVKVGEVPQVDKVTFSTPLEAGDVVVIDGTTVTLAAADSQAEFAQQIKDAMEQDTFDAASGRSITIDPDTGAMTFTYATDEGEITPIVATVGGTVVTPQTTQLYGFQVALNVLPDQGDLANISIAAAAGTSPVLPDAQTADAPVSSLASIDVAAATATWDPQGGQFIQSGALSMNITAAGQVEATFITSRNEHITMIGELHPTDGRVTFDKGVGRNAEVISANLTYSVKDAAGDPMSAWMGRAVSLNVAVEGKLPAMQDGDLFINGVNIGSSYAADDTLSPADNASGSAIAKAAAINRMAVASGVTVGEEQTLTLTGTPNPNEVVSIGGVDIQLSGVANTAAQAAAEIFAKLKASSKFAEVTGRSLSYQPGSSVISIKYAKEEGDVADIEFNAKASGLRGIVDTTVEHFTALPGTGVFAKVNENVMTGNAMTGTSVVRGAVFINGYASANIATVLNNTRATRSEVVRAINMITDKTGVKAIDTGSDAKGVTLVAADGRNIEIRFETNDNVDDFAARTGLRQGVQAGTYSLESKIPAPVVISSTGDITRTGLVEGNFTKNQSVVNTSPRPAVDAPVSQVDRVLVGGDPPSGADTETYSVTVNGVQFTVTNTAGSLATKADVRNALVEEINKKKSIIGVTASAGDSLEELKLTANTAGIPFSMSAEASDGADASLGFSNLIPNTPAQYKPLGPNDLMLNGIAIRESTPQDDLLSNTVSSSSSSSASAIAIANAINSQSSATGVRAQANPVVSETTATDRYLPATPARYSLFVNGTEVSVFMDPTDTEQVRRTNVMKAINERTGQHGVTAKDNGTGGLTLTTDGRNLSVWFDSSVKDLSAASFGLGKSGAVKQVSTLTFDTSAQTTVGKSATIVINDQSITVKSTAVGDDFAELLKSKIEANPYLQNIGVEVNSGVMTFTSKVAGSGFTISGVSTDSDVTTAMDVATVTANKTGSNDVTAIYRATETSATAKTMYGTVRMISDPTLLPRGMPAPEGAPPSDKQALLKATGRPFTVSVGDDGFGVNSNFSSLGFEVGTFGGQSSAAMDPPRVGRLAFQVGSSTRQVITIDLADFGKNGPITSEITGDVDLNVEDRTTRINSREGASAVLDKLDIVMDKINATRATMGAVMNRLDHVINNLTNVSMNLSASRSAIEDSDYASASTELAKTQIMQQAATAVLAQANTSQQTVLKLLGG